MLLLLSILLGWLLSNVRIEYTQHEAEDFTYHSYQQTQEPPVTTPQYRVQEAYNTLGITSNATDDEVKKAYRKMAMRYHPDRQTNSSQAEQQRAAEQFRVVNKAYEYVKQIRNIK